LVAEISKFFGIALKCNIYNYLIGVNAAWVRQKMAAKFSKIATFATNFV
jgi:hypothetical protein